MALNAFGPRGLTYNIAANSTASVGLRLTSNPGGQYTYQFINEGSSKVWFAWSPQIGVTCTIPTPGNPANAVCVLPNEIVIYNLCPDAFLSVKCEAGESSNLLVSPGEGM